MNSQKNPGRANFSGKVKYKLALAANMHCVRPGCARITHAYHADTDSFFNLAAASHDAAASDGGPRPAPELSREQRSAYGNGAWLCRVCAKLVDDLPDVYPLGTLASWQAKAQDRVMSKAINPMPAAGIDWATAVSNAKKFCARVREIRFDSFGPLDGFSSESMVKAQRLLSDSVNLQTGDHPLGSRYVHTVNTQLRIISSLRLMLDCIRSRVGWYYDDDRIRWMRSLVTGRREVSSEGREMDRVIALWGEIQEAQQHLVDFYMGRFDHSVLDQW